MGFFFQVRCTGRRETWPPALFVCLPVSPDDTQCFRLHINTGGRTIAICPGSRKSLPNAPAPSPLGSVSEGETASLSCGAHRDALAGRPPQEHPGCGGQRPSSADGQCRRSKGQALGHKPKPTDTAAGSPAVPCLAFSTPRSKTAWELAAVPPSREVG